MVNQLLILCDSQAHPKILQVAVIIQQKMIVCSYQFNVLKGPELCV